MSSKSNLQQAACLRPEHGSEEQHRVLALLGKPDLTVRVGAAERGSLQRNCWALLQELAQEPSTQQLQLLIGPDLDRSEHPPAQLEPTALELQQLRQGAGMDAVAAINPEHSPGPAALELISR